MNLRSRSLTLFSLSILAINSFTFSTKRFSMAMFSSSAYQGMKGDGNGGQGVVILPKDGLYDRVIIFMHGLGDTCDGWASLMPELGLQKTKFILPTASTKPVSLNNGYKMPAWTDVFGLDESSTEDKDGFNESRKRIDALIDAEVNKNIDSKKIIIGGFSQGGAVALHTGLRYKSELGGVVALSTWLPLRNDYPSELAEANKKISIWQCHGDEDAVVSFKWGKNTHDLLTSLLTTKPIFLTIEGMGHSSDPEEIRQLKAFLTSRQEI